MARDLYLTGRTIILDHGYGLFTVYAHLSRFNVKRGARVAKGDLLGLSGATGRASGPHLHWGAVVHRTKFNPMDLTRLVR
jgi:murein DD-endopeptidase MepM/ murein hydrolase activator NlpD